MSKKKKSKVSEEGKRRRTEAGKKNLIAYHESTGNARQQRTTHGVTSATKRKRFKDLRSQEGQWLKAVTTQLIDDLGGAESLNAGEQLILSSLETKLITLFLIGEYVDQQMEVVDSETKELLPVLQRSFLSYSESVRRDLEHLYGGKFGKKSKRVPTIADLIDKTK
jgi:hypothetical protein